MSGRGRQPKRVLTPADRHRIMVALAQGRTLAAIARDQDVTRDQVRAIKLAMLNQALAVMGPTAQADCFVSS